MTARETLPARLRQGPFGLGTAPLGGLYRPVSDADAAAALEAAWQGGVRYFDTAPLYGVGVAERRLGTFLRDLPRAEALVSTKVGRLLVPTGTGGAGGHESRDIFGPAELEPVRDYSRDGVRRSIAESAERMGIDRFDLVLIHDPDEYWDAAVGTAYPALAELRDEGVVGAIGVGMNQWQMLTRFVRETDVDAVLVAGRYTLLDRSAATELLPECAARGVAVIVGGVFNSGILADPRAGAHFNYTPAPPAVLDRARAMQRVCAEHGVPLAAAALQFPLRHPAVTTVLAGARDATEVTGDLALASVDLPEPLWAALAALDPV